MEDKQIIELFWKRDKSAIQEVEQAYQRLLYHIARNITSSAEDAEECVNDTYMKLWNVIPPERPDSLKNYAARIVRNLAIDSYRRGRIQGKDNEMTLVCEELSEVLADSKNDFEQIEMQELINGFLATLDSKTRVLFVKRYWQTESIQDLAKQFHMRESAVKMRLLRTRDKFRKYLEKGGVPV